MDHAIVVDHFAADRRSLRVALVTTFVPAREDIGQLRATVAGMRDQRYARLGVVDAWVLDEGDDPAVRALCARLGVRHFSRRHRPEYQAEGGRFAAR